MIMKGSSRSITAKEKRKKKIPTIDIPEHFMDQNDIDAIIGFVKL